VPPAWQRLVPAPQYRSPDPGSSAPAGRCPRRQAPRRRTPGTRPDTWHSPERSCPNQTPARDRCASVSTDCSLVSLTCPITVYRPSAAAQVCPYLQAGGGQVETVCWAVTPRVATRTVVRKEHSSRTSRQTRHCQKHHDSDLRSPDMRAPLCLEA